MFLNMDQLEKQLDNEEFQEIGSMAVFKVLEIQFQMFIKPRIYLDDEYVVMTRNYFLQYTQLEIPEFRDTLIQHMKSEFSAEACDFLATHQAPDGSIYFHSSRGSNQESHSGEADRTGQDEEATIVLYEEFQAAVADKPKGTRKKRKAAGGASGFNLPPKKLKEDHDTSGDASASTAGKSLVALQGLLECSTLAMEIAQEEASRCEEERPWPLISVLDLPIHLFDPLDCFHEFVADRSAKDRQLATAPFVTSFVTLTPKREDGGHIDSVSEPNLFSILPAPVTTTAVATSDVAGTSSALVLRAGSKPAIKSLFADSASPSAARPDIAGPSDPRGTKISADNFYVSQEMDSKTLQQIYVPKWNVINDYALDDLEVCRNMIDQLAPPWITINYLLSSMLGRHARRALVLKLAEVAEAICLRSQVYVAEAAETARVSELNNLKEQNTALEAEKSTFEGQVVALESVVVIKDTELASFNAQITKLTQDLSNFQLSCDELSIKAVSFESERDGLVDQVSSLEGIFSRLRDQVSGYELFKEQYEAVRDTQVKILSDRVAELDSELMGMVVHLDEEFYPCFLTTSAGRRWIISRGFRLAVMKCLQSPEYVIALGTAIGLAIDKGMQTGLVAGIDHEKAERGLAEVAAYDPSVEESIMGEPLSLDRVFDFPVDQLEPHPAYDFFAPRLLPEYAGNPNNNNGWIEADVPLLGELGVIADEPMVRLMVDEVAEPVAEVEEQMIAPVVDMDKDNAMLFGDDDFEDDASEGFDEEEVWKVNEEWLMAPVTPPLMPAVVIEDLSTRLGNLEYGHGQLVKKVIHVSDAEVAAGVSIEEISPRVFAIEGQGQQIAAQRDETIAELTQQVQALQAAIQQRDSQIQRLQKAVSEMGSRESTLMQCILGVDRRLA
ncbi:hypothetical protein Tco_1376938 [Tanacetum coccineum]